MPTPLASSDPLALPSQASLFCLDSLAWRPFESIPYLTAPACLPTLDSIVSLSISFYLDFCPFSCIEPCNSSHVSHLVMPLWGYGFSTLTSLLHNPLWDYNSLTLNLTNLNSTTKLMYFAHQWRNFFIIARGKSVLLLLCFKGKCKSPGLSLSLFRSLIPLQLIIYSKNWVGEIL